MRFTIKKKLIVAFLITIILPLTLISVIVANRVSTQSMESFITAARSELKQSDNVITTFFDIGKSMVTMLSSAQPVLLMDETLTSYMQATEPSFVDGIAKGGNEADIVRLLRAIHRSNPSFTEVFIGSIYGGFATSLTSDMPAGYDPRIRPWYKKSLNFEGEAILSDPYMSTTGEPVVSITRTISAAGRGLIGVAAIDASLKSLTDFIGTIKIGKTGYVILVDSKGTIIANPRDTKMNFKKMTDVGSDAFRTLNKMASGSAEVKMGNTEYLTEVHTSPKLGMKLIGFVEKSEIMEEVYAMINSIVIVAVVLLIVFMIVAFLFARNISDRISTVSEIFRDISEGEGDLTVRISFQGNDEIMELSEYFNSFVEKIENLVKSIKSSSDHVLLSSQEVAGGNNQLSSSTQQMASSLEETAASVEQITSSIKDTSSLSGSSATMIRKTSQRAQEGAEKLNDMAGAMENVKLSGEKIREIVDVVNDIAFQTNLLALNAAVEAARAGEEGKGFAVVAGEVRALAARSADAVSEIRELVGQNEVYITDANSLSKTTTEMLMSLIKDIQEASTAMADIEQRAKEQASGIEQINSAVMQMDEVTQRNASLVEELASSAEDLSSVSKSLSGEVGQFKVSEAGPASMRRESPVYRPPSKPTPPPTKPAKEPEPPKTEEAFFDDDQFEEF